MSPKCTHKCPYKREADGASFEDGRSHKPRHVALKAEKGKEMDPSLETPQEMWPYYHLDFGSAKLISNFWAPGRLENKHCFKLPS